MRFQNILFIILISIIFTGCGSCENQPKQKETNQTPITKSTPIKKDIKTPENNTNTGDNSEPTKLDKPERINETTEKVAAVTLKPVIERYCEAMKNGDNVNLEKVFSTKALADMKKEMRKEEITTLVDYLEFEAVGNKCEVVNEKIDGKTAVAEVITETYEDGTLFTFVKENNEWKMTNKSLEIDSVDKN